MGQAYQLGACALLKLRAAWHQAVSSWLAMRHSYLVWRQLHGWQQVVWLLRRLPYGCWWALSTGCAAARLILRVYACIILLAGWGLLRLGEPCCRHLLPRTHARILAGCQRGYAIMLLVGRITVDMTNTARTVLSAPWRWWQKVCHQWRAGRSWFAWQMRRAWRVANRMITIACAIVAAPLYCWRWTCKRWRRGRSWFFNTPSLGPPFNHATPSPPHLALPTTSSAAQPTTASSS